MIRTRDEETVRVVTIGRPERRNALRPAVAETETPVTYLHGADDAFCAGADLDVVADCTDPEAFTRRAARCLGDRGR